VGLKRTDHIAVTCGTAIDKYVDVLNMIRNQPTAIFPSELDDLNEPPAETLSICR